MKTKLLALSLIFSILLTGCGETEVVEEETVYIPEVGTEIVAPGFSREVVATGEIEANQSATLTSELRADVDSVNVQNGDTVSAGQTLIQMSSDDVATSLQTARSGVTNAQAQLTATQAANARSIQSAEVSVSTAETNLASTLAQNEKLKLQAAENLNSSQLSLDLSVAAAETNLDNAISAAYPAAHSAVSECDKVLGVSPTYRAGVEEIEKFIGALNAEAEQKAENAIKATNELLEENPANYDEAYSLLKSAEDATEKTLTTVRASTTSTTLTETMLANYVSTINSQLSAVRSAISTLESAKKNLESTKDQNKAGGSQTVINAQASYEATLAQLSANEESARKNVESAEAALASAKESANLNLVSAQTALDSAQNQLRAARDTAAKLTITAPFSGKITNVAVKTGQEVSAGAELISLANDGTLKIVAYLAAEDVARLNVGDEVKIATNSSDVIASIAPSADTSTKKYRVEILHVNPYLSVGDFVKLRFPIKSQNSSDGIYVPITAVQLSDSGNFVWTVVENENGELIAQKNEIEVDGLEGEYVHVVSGLSTGEEIITKNSRIIEDEGTIVERN